MSEELKPCPLCGKSVEIHGGAEDWSPTFYDPDSGGDPYYISCECGCTFSNYSYDAKETAEFWNRRADNAE